MKKYVLLIFILSVGCTKVEITPEMELQTVLQKYNCINYLQFADLVYEKYFSGNPEESKNLFSELPGDYKTKVYLYFSSKFDEMTIEEKEFLNIFFKLQNN